MTGFGRGEASENGIHITAEIKTLNGRYFDLSARLPGSIAAKELEIKERIQGEIHRGKVNLNIYLDKAKTGEPDIALSTEMIRSYTTMLQEAGKSAGISSDLNIKDLLHFDDIFLQKSEKPGTVGLIWELTCLATEKALETVVRMRRKEGGQLKSELQNQINRIQSLLGTIASISSQRVPEAMEKLATRLRSLIDEEKIDPDRMEMEIAILADKMDIKEEVVRLESHLKFFLEALDSKDAVGRRLNFLCQEINRELNTIGAKSNDSEISHQVVYAKETLEQIREQVQNIE